MKVTKELIEKHWPLSEVVISDMPSQGYGGHVGIVTAKEGMYTYKIPGEWTTKDTLKKSLPLFEFLNDKKFKHITTLLKTKEGRNFIEINNRFLYLLEFIEGKTPEENPETYKKFGAIAAKLHTINDCPYITKFSANYIVRNNFQDIAKKLSFSEDYLKVVTQQPDYELFPKTVIHADLAPGNSVEKSDGEIILIDWDNAGTGTTILDLGIPLISQFVSEDLEYNEASAKAFYNTYFSIRTISDFEKEHIFDAALFYALFYIRDGDIEKRWKRINWAIENRKLLESLYL